MKRHGFFYRSFCSCFLLFLAVDRSFAQTDLREDFQEKPGSCPPALPVQICLRTCSSDTNCPDVGKCCPTACGGLVCSRPVTMRREQPNEKPGFCPAIPTGRWVCSPTCRSDDDCRGTLKCCKNRCGALACQKPETQIIPEIVEIPAEIPYEPPRNPYDYYNN